MLHQRLVDAFRAGLTATLWLSSSTFAAEPVPVRLQPAETVLLPSNYRAAASVRSPNDAVVAAELTAPIAQIAADVGDSVARGERLAELDCTDVRLTAAQARAQVDAAAARVALAAQRLQRARTLSKGRFISADELAALVTEHRAAQADAKVIEAQHAIAARQVDKCTIEAPFDAAVLERSAQVGMLAIPGMPLFRLIDRSTPEVEARLAADEAVQLTNASRIWFESQRREYPLRLLRLSEVIDPQSRTRVARLAFSADAAVAGASGTLHWQVGRGRLPPELLVQRDGRLGMFVAQDGVARFVPLPDALPGRGTDVATAPGTLIVVDGQQRLHDGDPITAQ